MQVSASVLYLILSIWLVLFGVAYSGVFRKHSSVATDKNINLAKLNSEILYLSDDLSQMQRMQYMDSCRSHGMNCTRAEQCCSLQCLKYRKKCTYKLVR
ncbi:hypothetical protein ACLKA6_008040 [Drosophila palustris]